MERREGGVGVISGIVELVSDKEHVGDVTRGTPKTMVLRSW